MIVKTTTTKQMTLENEVYYKHKCKYCGKPFNKKHNREMYCSKECRKYALREQKARYQAKRRLKIKRKELVLRHNYKNLGSYGTCSAFHRRSKFEDEYRAVKREMERIGLRKNKF